MFDPYSKWLGIQAEQRPPNHYQLLGVSSQEKDAGAIEDAANQQILLVVNYKKGPHAEECRRLLQEIAQARDTLLDPQERKAYDAELRRPEQ